MDNESQTVIGFLSEIYKQQSIVQALYMPLVQRGCQLNYSFVTVSEYPLTINGIAWNPKQKGDITLGMPVTGTDGRAYELSVTAFWNETQWVIRTQLSVEDEEAEDNSGSTEVSVLPKRVAFSLSECLEAIRLAVADLAPLSDRIPGKTA